MDADVLPDQSATRFLGFEAYIPMLRRADRVVLLKDYDRLRAENEALKAERDAAYGNGWDAARLASMDGPDSSAFEGDLPAWNDLFERGLAVSGVDNTGEGYVAITKEGKAHLEYAVAAVAPGAPDDSRLPEPTITDPGKTQS